MRVLVAGGSGFVGRHIAKDLAAAGHDVSILSRDPGRSRRVLNATKVSWIQGDVTDPSSLRGKFGDLDAVVGAVQFPNYPVERRRRGLTFDRYDRQGTEHLLAEALGAGVQRYLYLSGAGADPDSEKSWYRAKGSAERALRDSGIRYAILRPSWAYGPGDRALNRFAMIARFSPVVPRIGLSPQKIQPVFVGDVATAVTRILERDRWGVEYEIGSLEIMTMHEVITTLLKALGKRRLILPIPAVLARVGAAPLMLLPTPPISPSGIDFAVQDGLVDPTKLVEDLDLSPMPLAEGLARYTPGR